MRRGLLYIIAMWLVLYTAWLMQSQRDLRRDFACCMLCHCFTAISYPDTAAPEEMLAGANDGAAISWYDVVYNYIILIV